MQYCPCHWFLVAVVPLFLLQLSMFNTPTTPTLTPTLKNISEVPLAHEEDPFRPLEHNHQGGFVPPNIDFAGSLRSTHSSSLGQENMSSNSNFCNSLNSQDEDSSSADSDSQSNSDYSRDSQSNDSHAVSKAYNTRGLKNGTSKSSGIKSTTGSSKTSSRKGSENSKVTPEEEAKKKMRRERNKQAAARCRKRRLDHTNLLTKQTEELDREKKKLEQECEKEKKEYERYIRFLEEHKRSSECKCKSQHQQQQQPQQKQPRLENVKAAPAARPATLDILNPISSSLPAEPLVSASTPSNGVLLEWFDGTGLTPLLQTPSAGGFMPGVNCISNPQIVANETVQSSNEATTPSKLVTL